MYKFVFFVPGAELEKVKSAVFDAGAGKMGDYDRCAWQVLGQGQFRPLAGSDPYIGKLATLTHVEEYRVEMVCSDECMAAAVAALKLAHPYEQPAFDVWRLAEF